MRGLGRILYVPSRAVVLILHEPDVKGEIAIDWVAFKCTPSTLLLETQAFLTSQTHTQQHGGRKRETHAQLYRPYVLTILCVMEILKPHLVLRSQRNCF